MPLELKEWVDRVFGRPVTTDFDRLSELDEFCGRGVATFQRLAEVFENAATPLRPYPDESLDQAFWDLGNTVLLSIRDESIEWDARDRLIRSFEPLFREFFAVRCPPVLGHLSEEGSPLNLSCYMWFDYHCSKFEIDLRIGNPVDSAFLASMRAILAIDHVACQESALHGLGHWHHDHPAAVEGIIGEFLARRPLLREELRKYADSARAGGVL